MYDPKKKPTRRKPSRQVKRDHCTTAQWRIDDYFMPTWQAFLWAVAIVAYAVGIPALAAYGRMNGWW